ncbi:MAG: hypothetical protein ACYTJ0_05375 [Planctomycetota bacterium]|jgi:hypothetical protein
MGKTLVTALVGAAILTPTLAFGQQDRVSSSEKGSVLIFSKVEIRWDAAGNVVQDTFIDIANDFPEDVHVLLYFVNGDPPLPQDFGPPFERAHPGWNWVDNAFELTKNEPTYWSALTGEPKGVSPFIVLDPGFPPGRPCPDGSGDRCLRGMVYAWAINSDGEEIRWNHLKGDATIINYRDSTAWEYNAWSFQVVAPVANGDPPDANPGVLNLDGVEYAPGFDLLLLDFYAVGTDAFSGGDPFQMISVDTDLTIHPVSIDVRQETDGPITTKAHFDVWNMEEFKFSGAYRCITCWDQWLLSQHGIPNHFLVGNLQTDKGKARIDGQASQLCDNFGPYLSEDASILGLAAKHLNFQFGASYAAAGTNLFGAGTESAQIQYDVLGVPPESTNPNEGVFELRKEQPKSSRR